MSQWPETSESLILRIRDPQDALAWSQFVAIYQPVVYRLSRRRGLQHVDAEDLCQQIFLSVARAVESWEPRHAGPRFRNWLGRVARRRLVREARAAAAGRDKLRTMRVDIAMRITVLAAAISDRIHFVSSFIEMQIDLFHLHHYSLEN